MTENAIQTPISSLEATVDRLLTQFDHLRAENLSLHKQLLAQHDLTDEFSDKNSRASQAIQRLIQRVEVGSNDR